MKILTVCSSWRVFGAETVTLKMLEGFKERGHDLLAVTSVWTDGDFSRRLQAIGVDEEVMPFGALVASLKLEYIRWTLNCLVRLPTLWWKWLRTVRRFQPDIIIFTSCKQALLLLPWLKRKPSVLIEHAELAPTFLIRWLYRHLHRRLACFVAVSQFMRSCYVRLGISSVRMHVIENGLSLRNGSMNESTINDGLKSASTARIGIVGRIVPTKGFDSMIRAAELLRERGLSFEVRAFGVGSSDYEAFLRRQVSEANLSAVWMWLGYEPSQEKIYQDIDICVVPSVKSESFGMVAVEAQAYERPVIATRIGALPETVHDGITGLLIDPDCPQQLADKIEYLMSNPAIAIEMGKAGRQRVLTKFTVKRMIRDFEDLFSRLLRAPTI